MVSIWYKLTVIAAAGLGTMWYLTEAYPPFSAQDTQFDGPGDVARGEQVFNAGDCASCHAAAGQPDRLKLGGGAALASPFGTFRPPNISQDSIDGIRTWTVTDLANLSSAASPQNMNTIIPPFHTRALQA